MAPDRLDVRNLLLIGGARSGKSRFGQDQAEQSGKTPVLIATATAGDAEMAARIAAHRAARGDCWRVVEEQLALVAVLMKEAAPDKVIVVDCLTLWLSNLMFAGWDLDVECKRLQDAINEFAGPVIYISNEVGSGIVPATDLGRRFRDAQGRLNQMVARACDAVVLIIAGIPLTLKPLPQSLIRL